MMDPPKAGTAPDTTVIERQIAAAHRQSVNELCGLTEDEVRIIEGDTN